MPSSLRPASRSGAFAVLLLLGAAAAGCGGNGKQEDPFVAQPAPDCPAPPRTPAISVASAPVGPASDPGCTPPASIVASALPAPRVIHLGTQAVNTSVPFTIPAETGGFSIVMQAVTASAANVVFVGSPPLPNSPVPLRVVAPDGSTFFDDTITPSPAQYPSAGAVFRGGRQGIGTFTAPNTSATAAAWTRGAPAGAWGLVVGDYASECTAPGSPGCSSGASTTGVYDVTVVLRPGPIPSTGTVDVDFYVVSTTLTASAAATDPHVARMLSTLGGIYAKAGLCLGQITFLDVPDWARARFAAGVNAIPSGPCDNLSQLSKLSRNDGALQVFLVDDIVQAGQAGGRVVGIDGMIPGPSGFGGTIGSGAVVNAADLASGTGCGALPNYTGCGADAVAAVIAHEGGHWMGLFHTTEKDGIVFDAISDTGTCDCHQCLPAGTACGQALLTADFCSQGACAGAENLMFWLVGGDGLTAQQGQVMRGNPLVR